MIQRSMVIIAVHKSTTADMFKSHLRNAFQVNLKLYYNIVYPTKIKKARNTLASILLMKHD